MMSRAEETSERYSMTALMRFNPEFMWGPLLRLNYPDILRFGIVSKDAKAIVDDETFWELKTRWDFEVEYERPRLVTFRRTWKGEYDALFNKASNQLLTAASGGHIDWVRELLGFGIDVDRNSYVGKTSLMVASEWGRIDVIRELLEWGADVNIRTFNGWAALVLASKHGYVETVEVLLEAKAEIENRCGMMRLTALMEASKSGGVEVVRVLLAKNADVNAQTVDGYTALRLANNRGQTEIVEMLLAAGADPIITPEKLGYEDWKL